MLEVNTSSGLSSFKKDDNGYLFDNKILINELISTTIDNKESSFKKVY